MVDALRRDGRLRSEAVARAMGEVPRHLFLPESTVETAYADAAVVTKHAGGVAVSSASQPSMVAIMLEQLDLRPGQRVLEIGAGTGYNAALMAHLVGPEGSVTSVDIDDDLVVSAAAHLEAAGSGDVTLVVADGAAGHPPGAPYDRIVLTVGSADVRPEWVGQLAPGGRLLLPLRVRGSQVSVAFDLGGDGVLRSSSVRACAFIRLRGIGAGPDAAVTLGAGWTADPVVDHTAVEGNGAGDLSTSLRAALGLPGAERELGIRLSPADVWDGLGLWLSLAEPSTVRLVARDDAAGSAAADGFVDVGGARVALVLPGPTGGFAAIVQDPDGGPARVRDHGAPGPGPAEVLAALVEGWVAAGRPQAADLRIRARPRDASVSVGPGEVTVELGSTTLAVTMTTLG
ncbi:protein-L-isoaspartate O-methyltransferase [Pseudonocardia sp. N23]|nr:protein-L-isoaspartate O-methyltransferase [Pseudonocardia sp. N23]